MNEKVVYKLLESNAWARAAEQGRYEGAPVDRADGYIHLSTNTQVVETARRHFAGRTGLALVGFDVAALGADLRWEPSRGGDLFPHLYGPLPAAAAVGVAEIATTQTPDADAIAEAVRVSLQALQEPPHSAPAPGDEHPRR